MEPVTTTMINTIVSHLAKNLKSNSSVQSFLGEFTESAVNWIRPIFLKEDNEYEKVIADLLRNPDSAPKKNQVSSAIASHIEDNPNDTESLKEMYQKLTAKENNQLDIEGLKAEDKIDVEINQEKA